MPRKITSKLARVPFDYLWRKLEKHFAEIEKDNTIIFCRKFQRGNHEYKFDETLQLTGCRRNVGGNILPIMACRGFWHS